MKRLVTAVALLALLATSSFAARGDALKNHPYRGDGSKGGSFHITVKDSLIGTTWARVTSDTGFTQMSTNATISWMYGPDSKLDSLLGGKGASGAVATAVWSGGGTADSTGNNNFFQDAGQVNPTSVSAVFSNGWSFFGNNYHVRREDTQFRVAGNWMLAIWVNSDRVANPATSQIVFSAYESPDIIQVGFDPNGNLFGRISDDATATWDSVGLTADRFDSTWHAVWLQTKSAVVGDAKDSLRITVDRQVSASVAFSNAATSLTTDTVMVGGFRAASSFLGLADEAYIIEDTTTFDAASKLYTWLFGQKNLGLASDSAMVRFYGVRSDTIYGGGLDTIKIGSTTTSDSTFSLYESAFLDTIESLPIVAFATGTSPVAGRLANIATGRYLNNHAVITVGKFDRFILDDARFSSTDIAMIDTVHFQVRVYTEFQRAKGAGTNYFVLGERIVTGPHEQILNGPWTIEGPAVVEVWARASASGSIGTVEINGFRGKYGR